VDNAFLQLLKSFLSRRLSRPLLRVSIRLMAVGISVQFLYVRDVLATRQTLCKKAITV